MKFTRRKLAEEESCQRWNSPTMKFTRRLSAEDEIR